MARTRHVALIAFRDAQILDVTGPLAVFARASRWLREQGRRAHDVYRVELVAPAAGPLAMSCGLRMIADRSVAAVRGGVDTLLVAGGVGTAAAMRDPRLLTALRRLAPRVRRLGSVCTGTFVLAAAGLLDGRRVTTHWSACARLARLFPSLTVDPDPIFVRDGNVYTSAGVTAGIDLCLALVEVDHGRTLALSVARQLVVFLKRPGGQAQFSAHLNVQLAERDALADVRAWIADHVDEDLAVHRLASRAAVSPRHFARVFRAETGQTPARFVQHVRVEAARRRLEEADASIEQIARECGFGTTETMRRAFLRELRVAPSDYRQRFRAAAPTTVEVGT